MLLVSIDEIFIHELQDRFALGNAFLERPALEHRISAIDFSRQSIAFIQVKQVGVVISAVEHRIGIHGEHKTRAVQVYFRIQDGVRIEVDFITHTYRTMEFTIFIQDADFIFVGQVVGLSCSELHRKGEISRIRHRHFLVRDAIGVVAVHQGECAFGNGVVRLHRHDLRIAVAI